MRTSRPTTLSGVTVGDGIVVLERGYRFGGGIASVAEAVRRADPDAVLETLANSPQDVSWLPVDAADPDAHDALAAVRDHITHPTVVAWS